MNGGTKRVDPTVRSGKESAESSEDVLQEKPGDHPPLWEGGPDQSRDPSEE